MHKVLARKLPLAKGHKEDEMEMHVCLNKQVVDHKNKGYQVK